MSLLNIWNTFVAWLPDNFQGIIASTCKVSTAQITTIDSCIISYWIIFFVAFALLLLLLLCKTKMIERLSKHLLSLSIIVWMLGVVVYTIGFYDYGVNGLSVVLRAIIASFKMFVVSHDLSRILPMLQTNTLYMSIFSLLHFLAAFITFLFIFKMLGFKIKSSLRLMIRSRFGSKDNAVHLFWGVNKASCQLAKDISNHPRHKDDTIIFVDIDDDSEENLQKKVTLNRITNAITITDNEVSVIEEIGAFVDNCYNGPASLSENNRKSVFKALRLRNVGNIICKSRVSRFYFLSDDEAQNISGALNLLHDTSLRHNGDDMADIFVHAHRDPSNDIFDHYSQYKGESDGLRIKVVDSAYLSVETLKTKEGMLPVNSVNVDSATGLVSDAFNAMIVGFGSTGQEAFRFLYEFSTFVNPDLKRVPFRCYAVDSRMLEIEGVVRAQMPHIDNDELMLINDRVDSLLFWNRISEIVNELNYVIVALNNDTLGLSFAVNLFKYVMSQHLANDRKLKIALRVYDSNNASRMERVVENLNRSADSDRVKIGLFGSVEDIYTCDNILLDKQFEQAKTFNLIYENSMNDDAKDARLSADEQWKAKFGNDTIPVLMAKYGISRYHAICDINRRIAQNLSNASHSSTKMILMGIDNDRLRLFNDYVNTRDKFSTKYDCDTESALLLRNMAVIEHERWIASHKLMGYTYGLKTDYVKRLHEDICDWFKLDEVTQSYDCNVVDTTIKMAYKECNK